MKQVWIKKNNQWLKAGEPVATLLSFTIYKLFDKQGFDCLILDTIDPAPNW